MNAGEMRNVKGIGRGRKDGDVLIADDSEVRAKVCAQTVMLLVEHAVNDDAGVDEMGMV